MKIKNDDYNELKQDIKNILPLSENKDSYIDRISKIETMKNLDFEKCYRWQLYTLVDNNKNNFKYTRKLYEYMNDNQIDTALRHIIIELQ